jgi:N-acetylmuramoyl-L-alanine amidase
MRIVLDPGHGGVDSGCISNDSVLDLGAVYESNSALMIAILASEYAKNFKDLDVMLTRTQDSFVSLSARVAFSNDNNADVFVSLHHNARVPERPGFEVETYYMTELSESSISAQLAQSVHRQVLWSVNNDSGIQIIDRGIKQANFYVLRETLCPAILVELGFLTDAEELEWLQGESHKVVLARAVIDGIRLSKAFA